MTLRDLCGLLIAVLMTPLGLALSMMAPLMGGLGYWTLRSLSRNRSRTHGQT